MDNLEGEYAQVVSDMTSLIHTHISMRVLLVTDLGSCCMKGLPLCAKCMTNIRFRGGGEAYCEPERELVKCVLSGVKPVGTMALRHPSTKLSGGLRKLGLEVLVDGTANRWGMHEYAFALPATGNRLLRSFANLDAVERVCGVRVDGTRTVREHVQSRAFLDETDTFIERGIVYGYPLWSSIALELGK